nr:hypothetical protein CFP56_07625 [Quercus suber]
MIFLSAFAYMDCIVSGSGCGPVSGEFHLQLCGSPSDEEVERDEGHSLRDGHHCRIVIRLKGCKNVVVTRVRRQRLCWL